MMSFAIAHEGQQHANSEQMISKSSSRTDGMLPSEIPTEGRNSCCRPQLPTKESSMLSVQQFGVRHSVPQAIISYLKTM
jgi:hypothetical protein